MAKKNEKKVDATKMSDEQLQKTVAELRGQMKEHFDKWMTVYDEDATADDVELAKKYFDEEVDKYRNQTYVIAESNAAEFASLVMSWNSQFGHWQNGGWKGVAMFNKVMLEHIERYTKDRNLPFEVDYATLMFMYQTMSNPSGYGIESAMAMAKFENYDLETGEQLVKDNYITYSHLLQNIINVVRDLTNADKKLKLMRERINIAKAGIKIDWKITEIEEFIELHDVWLGESIPDDKELASM